MRLHHAIAPVALALAALGCTSGGFAGGGKAEKEEDAGEDKKGDKPVEVSGAFLVCGAERDAAVQVEKEDTYGCAAVDGTSRKRLSSATFTRLDVTLDGKQRKASPVAAPAGSFWHTLFRIPTGKSLTSVTGSGDFASAPVASASVAFQKPLGQASDGAIPLEPPPPPLAPAPMPPAAHRIFVTSQRFNGDLGGLAGADAKCAAAAKVGKLKSTYKAMIASLAEARVIAPYLAARPDVTNWAGEPLASVPGPLIGPPLAAPVVYDEVGYEVHPSAVVWTGADPVGGATPATCGGWQRASGDDGVVGYAYGTDPTEWLSAEARGCDQLAHLFCISDTPEPF